VFVLPTLAVEGRPQKHRRRKQPGEIPGGINLVGLFSDVSNGAAREEESLAAIFLCNNPKWHARDAYKGNDVVGIR
jgi:hypothetical protein